MAFFYFKKTCAGLESKGETYFRFFGQYLQTFPVAAVESSVGPDKKLRKKIALPAQRLSKLVPELRKSKTDRHRDELAETIRATDREIDELVYDLYGITEQERKIIEETT